MNTKTPLDRALDYRVAVGLARFNARTARTMAAAFPNDEIKYLRDAANADERADHYERLAKTMLEIAGKSHADAA